MGRLPSVAFDGPNNAVQGAEVPIIKLLRQLCVQRVLCGVDCSAEGSQLIQYIQYNHNHRDNKNPLTEIQEN
jgi:hypothetical protein